MDRLAGGGKRDRRKTETWRREEARNHQAEKHEAQADTSLWQIKHTCRPAHRGEKKHMQVSGRGNWHVHASRAALSLF